MDESGIVVRLFAGLERGVPGAGTERRLSAAEAPSVAAVLESLGLQGRAGLVLVNGVHAGLTQALAPGDEVDLFPPIGGG
jgi:molybdopterin converting factor small subunit